MKRGMWREVPESPGIHTREEKAPSRPYCSLPVPPDIIAGPLVTGQDAMVSNQKNIHLDLI